MKPLRRLIALGVCLPLAAGTAHGAFHFMQIEQIIGGVNGDTTAQAIQLRMRFASQNFVSATRLRATNASGGDLTVLKDLTTDVAVGTQGRRVLITTPNFANYTDIPLVSDFTMDPIPAANLAAGQVQFTDDFGTLYWLLSWGGGGFTGSTTGSTSNDVDGNFGPAFGSALPSATLQALQFTGAANAASTNNAAQYALTAGAATFINNAGTSFTLTAPSFAEADFNESGAVNDADFAVWSANFGAVGTAAHLTGDADGDEDADGEDFLFWQRQTTGSAAAAGVPEPAGLAWVALAVAGAAARRRRLAQTR